MDNWNDLDEELKTEEHQVQLNKFYDNVISEYLSEIKYTKSAVANKVLTLVRQDYSNEEIANKLLSSQYIDWSPWQTEGAPYKFFIVADYYRWREHFKQSGTLMNQYTRKIQD